MAMADVIGDQNAAAAILARLDRLPASRSIWAMVTLLSLGGMLIAFAMLMVVVSIGVFGPRTTDLELEQISH
jgi:hypothetical protein